MKYSLFATLSAVLLAGCSSNVERNPVFDLAAQFIPAIGAVTGAENRPAAPGFDPADISANPSNFSLVQVPMLGDPVAARLISVSGRTQTWLAQNGFSATYRDEILVATRGLGEDLIAATAQGTRAAIRAGGGSAVRVHDRIGNQNEILQERFTCQIVSAGVEDINLGIRTVSATKYAETCRSDRTQFENSYWVDGAGRIMSSLQFITRDAGYLRRSAL